jgi:hypothetical protein
VDGALIARYDELIRAKTAQLAEQQAQRRARAHATAQQLTATLPLRPETCCDGSPAAQAVSLAIGDWNMASDPFSIGHHTRNI